MFEQDANDATQGASPTPVASPVDQRVPRNDAYMDQLGTPAFAGLCKSMDTRPAAERVLKRVMDIVISLVVLSLGVVLFPVTILVLVAAAVSAKGSPIYTQRRLGRYGKPLNILKLRTMVASSDDLERHLSPEQIEQWHREHKVDDDPRITRVGKVLRRLSLDEVPQFVNVLLGQMSVIGPRPITAEELEWFADDKPLLLSQPAGITGAWQVDARTDATFQSGARQQMELDYCRNATFTEDMRIFVRTFSVMFDEKTGK